MSNDPVPSLLARATKVLEAEFGSLPAFEPASVSATDTEAMERVLEATAHRLGNNYPYFHPLYAGQMLKPPAAQRAPDDAGGPRPGGGHRDAVGDDRESGQGSLPRLRPGPGDQRQCGSD